MDRDGGLVEHRRAPGDLGRPAQQRRDLRPGGAAVRAEHGVGVEHRDERSQVPAPGGGEERLDNLPLSGGIDLAIGGMRAPHPPASPARELAGGGGGAIDQGSDLLEGQVEHVVQHEREPLGRGEQVEHHQQREADRVGQDGLVGRGGHVTALGDRYGRRRIFAGGVVIFAIGSADCALSPDAIALVAFRALQGAGGAAMLALTLSLITDTFPPETRAAAIGTWAAVGGTGFGVGPAAGGILLSLSGWASVFWVNLPFAVLGDLEPVGSRPRLPRRHPGRRAAAGAERRRSPDQRRHPAPRRRLPAPGRPVVRARVPRRGGRRRRLPGGRHGHRLRRVPAAGRPAARRPVDLASRRSEGRLGRASSAAAQDGP